MNPARLINIATQQALSSGDTPEHQSIIRFAEAPPEIRSDLATYILFGNRPE